MEMQWETDKESRDPVFQHMKWILTSDAYECDRIVSFLRREMGDVGYMGLDIEFDPRYRGGSDKTALIQLGIHTGHCLLVQVTKMNRLPPGLEKLLTDPAVLKIGVAIRDDVCRLFNDFRVRVQGWFDLRRIAPPAKKLGLAALTEDHLGTVLPKDKAIVESQWSGQLSPAKRAYAARDAYVAVLLTNALVPMALQGDAIKYLTGMLVADSHSWRTDSGVSRDTTLLQLQEENVILNHDKILEADNKMSPLHFQAPRHVKNKQNQWVRYRYHLYMQYLHRLWTFYNPWLILPYYLWQRPPARTKKSVSNVS